MGIKFFKKILLIGLIISAFILPEITNAQVRVDIEIKEAFEEGEKATFTYTIISDSEQEITFIASFDCPAVSVPLLDQKTVRLKPNIPFQGTSSAVYITEFVEPQACIARIKIIVPFYQKTEREFKIETKPSFELRVLPYEDEACTKPKTVFIKGERVYFNYDSEVPSPDIAAVLIAPDGIKNQLTLPTSIILDQTGKYILETEAKKEGYKTNIQTLELVVLEEEPRTIDRRICNANGICEPDRGETIQSCPQDCLSPEVEALIKREKIKNIFTGTGIFLFIVALFSFYWFWLRKVLKKKA